MLCINFRYEIHGTGRRSAYYSQMFSGVVASLNHAQPIAWACCLCTSTQCDDEYAFRLQ